MSKPIFVIRLPHTSNIDRETFKKVYKEIDEQLFDYHVLCLLDSKSERVEFECYNAPHTEIEFEELKKIVLEIIKSK
jgi:hypothetical protein